MRAITQLRDEKYATWEWNYGHSPRYNFSKRVRTAGGSLEAALAVSDGVIAGARFYGDFFNRRDPEEVAAALIGVPHHSEALRQRLADLPVDDYFHNVPSEALLSVLI